MYSTTRNMPTLFSLPFYDKYYVTFMFLTALVFLSWGTYAEQFSTRKMLWRKNESPVNGLINCYKNAEAHCQKVSSESWKYFTKLCFSQFVIYEKLPYLAESFCLHFCWKQKTSIHRLWQKNGLSVRSSFLYCFWINFDENSNLGSNPCPENSIPEVTLLYHGSNVINSFDH